MKVVVRKRMSNRDGHWVVYCLSCVWNTTRSNWFDAMWLANYHAETHKQ